MTVKSKRILVAGVVAALVAVAGAWGDPPDRVGRLNFVQGSVSFKPGNLDEWTAATLNYPLTAGDSLWTEVASRAEVHVGSTAIRLGAGTEFSLLELDDQKVQISLPQGLLNVRLRQLDSDESFEIDTPTMSVSLLAPGSYRLEVGDDGGTRATVNEGQGEILVDGLAYPLRANQAAYVAQADLLSIQIVGVYAQDEWDRWCAERDRKEDRLASVQYVPRTMIGCEDLDWYGSWSVSVEYGPVWAPRSLPAGWAPYRYGHWAWVEPWGWTWIDDMPWGFAPFHYGRWAMLRSRWVWMPGSIAHRPVYAPALVVFVDIDVAVSNGRIGWFPLGPGEVYVPAYRVSQGYLRKVNVPYVRMGDHESVDPSKIRHAYRQVPGAYTVVDRRSFNQAKPVRDSRVLVQEQELARARVQGATAPVAPQRESVLGASRAKASRPPETTRERKVVVRNAPSSSRIPFADQQKELAEHPGRPVEPRQQQVRKEPEPGAPRWIKQPSRVEPGSRAAPAQAQPQVRQAPQDQPQVKQGQQGQQAQPQVRQPPREQPQVKQGRQGQQGQPAPSQQRKKVWKKKKLPNGQEVWVEEWAE